MSEVNCNEEMLYQLLWELDKLAWECNDGEGAALFYEIHKPGDTIGGGTGGGLVTDTLWVHPEFVKQNLYDKIFDMIKVKADSIWG